MPKTNKVEDRVGRAPMGGVATHVSFSLPVYVCVFESVSFVLLSACFDIKSRRKQTNLVQNPTKV